MAYRYPHDLVQDSRSIIQVLTGQAALSKDFDIKEEGSENGMRKIRLYPKDPTPQMVEALIWVDAQTFIRRVDLVDFYGNHNDVNFTKFIPDVMLGSGTFQFTPPKGVDVEDRTDKAKVQEQIKKAPFFGAFFVVSFPLVLAAGKNSLPDPVCTVCGPCRPDEYRA